MRVRKCKVNDKVYYEVVRGFFKRQRVSSWSTKEKARRHLKALKGK